MKRSILTIALGLLLSGFWHGAPSFPTSIPIQSAQIWGGGLISGCDHLATGVHLCRTDEFSGYLYGTDTKWHNLITLSSFSTAACDVTFAVPGSCFGIYPLTGTSASNQNNSGVIELCDSPASTSTAYMYYGGYIFKTTNLDTANPDNLTWVNTNQLAGGGFANTNDGPATAVRKNGRFMACDPNNVNHVFVGTFSIGLWETKDGGSHFTQVSSSDIPTSTSAGYLIAFDPNSGTTGGLTNKVYVFTSGSTAGLYATTNGGGSGNWALTTSSPITGQHMIVDPNGIVWLVDGAGTFGGGNLQQYSGGSWTAKVSHSNLHSVASNPLNANHMVAVTGPIGGDLYTSSDAGVTWTPSGTTALSFTLASGDAPWQSIVSTNVVGAVGDIAFDAQTNDKLLVSMGQAYWSTTFPGNSNFTWTVNVFGIQEEVGAQIIVPTTGVAVAAMQDVGSCTFSIGIAPSSCSVITQSKNLEWASGLAVSPTDSSFMVAKISQDFLPGSDYSGSSTDNFTTFSNYLPFNSWHVTVAASAISGATGGTSGLIRITVGSTSGLSNWSAGSGSIVCGISSIFVSGNVLSRAGTSCYAVTNVQATTFDLLNSTYTSGLTTQGGSYTLYTPTGLSDIQGALNIIGIASDGGKIQVNYMAAENGLANNNPVCITGSTGTTEANGCWIIASLVTGSTKTFDLGPTSTFTNAYTGGAVATSWGEFGGSIAAASNTNITVVPNNNAIPRCTTDGGATWSQVTWSGSNPIPPIQTTVTNGPYAAGTTAITVSSTTGLSGQTVRVPMDNGLLFVSTITVNSSTSLTLASAIPAGRSILNGANVYIITGWGFSGASAQNRRIIDTDKTTGQFYAVNTGAGLLTWSGCGTTTLVNSDTTASATWQLFGLFNSSLKCVPNETGQCFYTAGPQNAPATTAATKLQRFCNGAAGSVTFQAIKNTFGPEFFGFGSPKPGSLGYASIYFVGWYDPTDTDTEANSLFGVWESTDDPNHGSNGMSTCSGTRPTFHQVCSNGTTAAFGSQCPNGANGSWPTAVAGKSVWMPGFTDISGDPTAYGYVYYNTTAGPFWLKIGT